MVCVSEEDSVECCVYMASGSSEEDKVTGNSKKNLRINVHANYTVNHLIQEICRTLAIDEFNFELCIMKPNNVIPLADSKQKLLKDVGVVFNKDAFNDFVIRDISTDGCNGVCIDNNTTEDVAYRDNDDLLLGASASPTASEEPSNLAQTSDELLISSVLLRQDSIPYVGLVNQAMTCYLNSLLQALYMTPEFRNALYNWEFDACDSTKSIPYQLQKLFLNLQTSTKSAVETTELTRSFGWDLSEAWQQHDIQELCRVMFDALEQKFKDTDQADLINRLYQGKMIDYVKCLECGTEKSRIDTFLDIPLPVRPFGSTVAYGSIEEALRAFVQPETLDGNNQYFCDKCNKKCDAHKGLKFSTIPYLLTLHLKRFDFDYTTMHRIKLNDKVMFPDTLDLNSFITTLAPEETTETTAEEITGVKCDDSSTTDSGSALDDEGCQATDMTSSNTSVMPTPTTNNINQMPEQNGDDFQEDDEGIDVSSGATNMQENEKNRRHNESKGPYVYELFSIMIHSGSASGGHYYAYIKDFRKGKWFCFDDQTVSRITHEDIYKTYGGGPLRSYYSGAYSSSTNAYMLMYRQIDPERNVQAMTTEEFPPHIKELLQSLREREENDRLNREREMVMNRMKVFYNHPINTLLLEVKLILHNDSTLREATEEVYRRARIMHLVPLEQCRLVSYNRQQDLIECSFEGREEEPISEIIASCSKSSSTKNDWLLEIRNKDDPEFVEYKPGGVNIKVYAVNIETEDVNGPITIRGYEMQTIAEFKGVLAKTLNMNEQSMKIALQLYSSGNGAPTLLENDDDEPISQASICHAYKLYVANALDEDPEKPFIISKFHKIIDKFEHIISLDVVLPVNDKWTLEVLSIPPLDLNQNCDNKQVEAGSGEPATNGGASTSPNLPRATSTSTVKPPAPPATQLLPETENGGASASANVPRSTPVQQLLLAIGQATVKSPPETEDTVAPSGGHSDQSNSEDSSLSDSDRTLVGDSIDQDQCLAQLSSTSNSPAASEQHLSSPEDPQNVFLEQNWDDEIDVPKRCTNYYFKATEIPTEPNEHVGKTLKVLVDKRTNLMKLKKDLEPYVGVPMEYFKIYRQYSTQEIECSRLTETLSSSRDGEKLFVKLGRVLKENELAGKVYQLIPNCTEPIRFLCDFVIGKGMTVAQAKKEILELIRKQYNTDIPYNRCRLRKKNWKNPTTVYRDDQKFVDDLPLHSNWDMFIQEIPGDEVITHSEQLLLFVRQWCPSTMELKPFQEIMIETRNVAELKEKISALSDIPIENIEISLLKGSFPFEVSVLSVHTELEWNTTINDWPFTMYDDGSGFLFRDNREKLKELTIEERKEICGQEKSRLGRVGKTTYSPRKERALKIYLDTSPKKSDYPEVD